MDLHGEVYLVKIPIFVFEIRRTLLSLAILEDKGSLLTVKDDSEKLGGHGREMMMSRQGISFLVDMEFRDGLMEKKGKDMRGSSSLQIGQRCGRFFRRSWCGWEKDSFLCNTRSVQSRSGWTHQLTHIAFTLWCRVCIPGSDREAPHLRQDGGEETVAATLIVSLDCFCWGHWQRTTPALTPCDGNFTYSLGLMMPKKLLVPYAIQEVCVFLQGLGHTRMVLESNG